MGDRSIDIKGQGHMVSVKGLSKAESAYLKTALSGEGVIDTLIATGQIAGLSPAHRQLAKLLEGDVP